MLFRKLYYGLRSFRTLRYSEEQLASFQHRLLDDLIAYTYENVPFYQETWDAAGFSPSDFRTMADLEKLPVIDAYAFRPHIGDLREAFADGIGGVAESSGSGGQGTLEAAFDTASFDWVEALHMRGLMLQGCIPGRTQSHYNHEDFGGGIGRRLVAPKKRVKTRWSLEQQLAAIEEHGSPYLIYFPQPLFTLAKKMMRSDRDYDISPDIIFTAGEVLTPTMRRVIETAFDSTVRDNYQTNEVIQIGWECPEAGGYHVAADSVIVEVLDGEGQPVEPGEAGDVVITGLVNRVTPIIRYNMGDIAVRGRNTCTCNTVFPVIDSLNGRRDNVVTARDGTAVFPSQIIELLSHHVDLLRFRFIEEDEEDYRLVFIPNEGFSQKTVETVQEELRQELQLYPVTFDEVETIDKTDNGKMQPVISRREHTPAY